MKKWLLPLAYLTIGIILMGPAESRACTEPAPDPPPEYWVIDHGRNPMTGKREFWVGLEISLFPPPTTTACACGLRFDNFPPASLDVLGAKVAITNTVTKEMIELPEFQFSPNPTTSAGLGAGLGGNWFGFFDGFVPGFQPPELGEDEVFKLWFQIELDPADVPFVDLVSFAGGEGLADGNPNFDPPHPTQVMVPLNRRVVLPEPTGLAMAVWLLAVVGLGRRFAR